MRLCVHSASFIVCYLCICWSLDSQPLVLALKHLHDGNKVFRLIPLCIHLCFLPTKMEVSWADYYVLMYKKQELHPFPALSPCLPPSLLSSLASSAVWSMGPGQVAKHVQPSLPPPPSSSTLLPPFPLPSRRPPVQLCRSPQVPARSDVQHGRQHVRSSPLFTGAERSKRRAPSGSTARVRILAGEPAPPDTEFTGRNLSSKTQTNEVLLIKHSFIAGFYRLALGEDLWRDTFVIFVQIQVYILYVLILFWVNLNFNLWLVNPFNH